MEDSEQKKTLQHQFFFNLGKLKVHIPWSTTIPLLGYPQEILLQNYIRGGIQALFVVNQIGQHECPSQTDLISTNVMYPCNETLYSN